METIDDFGHALQMKAHNEIAGGEKKRIPIWIKRTEMQYVIHCRWIVWRCHTPLIRHTIANNNNAGSHVYLYAGKMGQQKTMNDGELSNNNKITR